MYLNPDIVSPREISELKLGLTVQFINNSEFDNSEYDGKDYAVSLNDKTDTPIVSQGFSTEEDARAAVTLIENLVCSLFYPSYRAPDENE